MSPRPSKSKKSTETTPGPHLPGESLEVPDEWGPLLEGETRKAYWSKLNTFLASQQKTKQVYPPRELIFNALAACPPEKIKVVVLGQAANTHPCMCFTLDRQQNKHGDILSLQDPYHDNGQAHGLAFSVLPGVKIPPSLRNMFKELDEVRG